MAIQTRPEHFGPYDIVRELAPTLIGARAAARFVARRRDTGNHHTLYRLQPARDAHDRRKLIESVERVGSLDHPHLTSVEAFSFDVEGHAWLGTRFHGHHGGLMTLEALLETRGGRLTPDEVGRVLDHLLSAVAHAQTAGIRHGELHASDVLVDRHGSLAIELLGLSRAMATGPTGDGDAQDDVRSCLELAHRTLTGRSSGEGAASADAMGAPLLAPFFATGLDPALGFTSADEALAALRTAVTIPEESVPRVRSVFRRLRAGGWQRGRSGRGTA